MQKVDGVKGIRQKQSFSQCPIVKVSFFSMFMVDSIYSTLKGFLVAAMEKPHTGNRGGYNTGSIFKITVSKENLNQRR